MNLRSRIFVWRDKTTHTSPHTCPSKKDSLEKLLHALPGLRSSILTVINIERKKKNKMASFNPVKVSESFKEWEESSPLDASRE
jgi:hypothetical protein